MNTAEEYIDEDDGSMLSADWQMQLYLQEQEERVTDTLNKIHRHMVLSGRLDNERFNELVYLTGVRAKFN